MSAASESHGGRPESAQSSNARAWTRLLGDGPERFLSEPDDADGAPFAVLDESGAVIGTAAGTDPPDILAGVEAPA